VLIGWRDDLVAPFQQPSGQQGMQGAAPSSNDIPYFELWKQAWNDIDFDAIKNAWLKE